MICIQINIYNGELISLNLFRIWCVILPWGLIPTELEFPVRNNFSMTLITAQWIISYPLSTYPVQHSAKISSLKDIDFLIKLYQVFENRSVALGPCCGMVAPSELRDGSILVEGTELWRYTYEYNLVEGTEEVKGFQIFIYIKRII